jgi:hypothetical protein
VTGRSLILRSSRAFGRELRVVRDECRFKPWHVALHLPRKDSHAVFAVGERLQLDDCRGRYMLWLDSAAFEVLEHEARAIAEFAHIPLPVSLTAAEVSPSPCASAVVGTSMELKA